MEEVAFLLKEWETIEGFGAGQHHDLTHIKGGVFWHSCGGCGSRDGLLSHAGRQPEGEKQRGHTSPN